MTVERYFIKEAKKAALVDEYLRRKLWEAGYSHVELKRTPLGTRVIIHALRPGMVIGPGGENIKKLTKELQRLFDVENPHIEVERVENPYLDANIVAWRIARAIEDGIYFKRAALSALERVMAAGARGVEIRLSGKLPGARAKTWRFKAGHMRKCGQEAVDQALVAYAQALTKPGAIGVKVTIIPPEARFSDEVVEKVPQEVKETKEAGEETAPESSGKKVEKKDTEEAQAPK